MQAHLTHGSLANAAFVKRPCIDFKKFIEKALSHGDAAYHREAALAAKDFISSMESAKDIYTCIGAERAKRRAENKKNLTSVVKTVLLCASNNIPLRGHFADKISFMKLLQSAWMPGRSFEETLCSDGWKCKVYQSNHSKRDSRDCEHHGGRRVRF